MPACVVSLPKAETHMCEYSVAPHYVAVHLSCYADGSISCEVPRLEHIDRVDMMVLLVSRPAWLCPHGKESSSEEASEYPCQHGGGERVGTAHTDILM